MKKVKVKLNGLYIGIAFMSYEEIAKAEKEGFTIVEVKA